MGKRKSFRDNSFAFVLKEDKEKLNIKKDNINNLYNNFKDILMDDDRAGSLMSQGKRIPVVMSSSLSKDYNIWDFKNDLVIKKNKGIRMDMSGIITKEKLPENIQRQYQQYFLMLEYDFIGPTQLGNLHLNYVLDKFSKHLPVGYTARRQSGGGLNRNEKHQQLWLVLLIVAIIYFMCSILLESFLQPLAVILIIPITFIGVFLTFYLFNLNFDQGGYASLVLLCGLTVNSAIFIINDFNNIRKQHALNKNSLNFQIRTYMKAFNSKILPIIMAIITTVLGLVPFLAAGQKETFWFPLAAGTMGGLIFSLTGIYLILPLFFLNRKKNYII